MLDLVERMLDRLCHSDHAELISWAAPIPSFGSIEDSTVATLGINPSNREFVDAEGLELTGNERRFHTLGSLGLSEWSEANSSDTQQIADSCFEYFFRNPYNGWFKRLDAIIAGTGRSYYDRLFPACHIDLLPFATDSKWATLTTSRRNALLRSNTDLLIELIRVSKSEVMILNGQSVVTEFQAITGANLDAKEMPSWSLPRANSNDVTGIAYSGYLTSIAGELLPREIRILGFNHNIQSSFGVTSVVTNRIAKWVGDNAHVTH